LMRLIDSIISKKKKQETRTKEWSKSFNWSTKKEMSTSKNKGSKRLWKRRTSNNKCKSWSTWIKKQPKNKRTTSLRRGRRQRRHSFGILIIAKSRAIRKRLTEMKRRPNSNWSIESKRKPCACQILWSRKHSQSFMMYSTRLVMFWVLEVLQVQKWNHQSTSIEPSQLVLLHCAIWLSRVMLLRPLNQSTMIYWHAYSNQKDIQHLKWSIAVTGDKSLFN
jgi:hypothetical protein